MTTRLKRSVCLLGLSLLFAQHAVAEDKTKSLQPIPYTPTIKNISVAGDKAYLLDSQGKRTALGDGTYNTDNGMIIIVGGKVQSPRDPASGQATGKRQHKPVNLSNEMDKRGLNPQPLPPKSMGQQATKVEGMGIKQDLNPQPLPPKENTDTHSMRSQIKADSHAKSAEAASNVTKKNSDTAKGISQNLR